MTSYVEIDMLEFEGLSLGIFVGRVAVLSWAEEPVERDDDEVDNVGIEAAVRMVVGVDGVGKGAQDSDVDWVGAARGLVVVFELLEESRV